MSILQAMLLGAVQGLTEFIPISSSGHLVLVPAALDWGEPGLAFDVLLHAASLLALFVYFSGDLVDLTRGVLARDRDALRLLALLAIATVPAVLAGVLLGDYFEETFTDEKAAAVQLLITAVILVAAEQALGYHERRSARTGSRLRHVGDMGAGDAGVIGIAQAVSILPGISRSGSTIGAGLALSMTRDDAARFSFLLAIPALIGATLVQLPELGGGSLGLGAGAAGFFTSLVSSYVAITALIRYLRSNTLYPFAAYCVIAGIAFYLIV
ncbi:MAG: undecaprenyl-diphosphate phosphatase [Actinomycetota bacterium]